MNRLETGKTANRSKAHKKELKRYAKRFLLAALCIAVLLPVLSATAFAEPVLTVDIGGTGDAEAGGQFGLLDAIFIVAILALAPSILIMMTSFLRIIIVLSFTRTAIGTQQSPPNQVLIGLALFLTLFIMSPVYSQIKEEAYQPYREGKLTQEEAVDKAIVPLKEFMLKQVYTEDLNLFLSIANDSTGMTMTEAPELSDNEKLMELDLTVIVPAFATSELKRAFTIGFIIYIPFLIIDMVVSSTLMSMGMVMLPPSTIALPFKIMLFVLVDGWGLLFSSIITGFH